jgi:hypothetical protein
MKWQHAKKKPVVIDFIKYGDMTASEKLSCGFIIFKEGRWMCITIEGYYTLRVDDYIIKGVKGEYYPCRKDIFEQTYEVIDD